MSALTIEGLLSTYARCLKAYFEEGCHDEVYEAQGKAGSAIVAAFDVQAARIAALEAALCAFAPNNIKPGHWARPFVRGDEGYPRWRCNHCNARAREWQEIEHTSDCPVVLAVALLPKEATDE